MTSQHIYSILFLFLSFLLLSCTSSQNIQRPTFQKSTVADRLEEEPEKESLYQWFEELGYNNVWVVTDEPPRMEISMTDFQNRINRSVRSDESGTCDTLSGERIIYRIILNEEGNPMRIKPDSHENVGCVEQVQITIASTTWEPAKVNGEPVKIYFSVPVKF
ncbi:hypothetical protein [Rhodohalobacter sp.]|uniref:hypothetical protein n=1 Tax=Rhodohalobacter sp. TaxID=1974210 RepID=UPI002ACEEACE|nr:hypothetical protein [Rhodohalobacter sp.]MDZ7757867.1 hypothetical protein [Rhodohalobacter sp.]